MRLLTLRQKILLTIIENFSVFLAVFLNQMIITVFPAYESVKLNDTLESVLNSTSNPNCTMKDPSNSYVAILIGCKYCTELIMLPIVGLIADHYHPPLILFWGLVIETIACVVYSSTGNFYITIVARVLDGLGNSLVSASGLTIIYMIYLRDRPRNRLITIDSILTYISACVSPVVAGYIYESLADSNEALARLCTFMLVGPLFLLSAIVTMPFAFNRSRLFSNWFTQSNNASELINGDHNHMLMDSLPVSIINSDIKKVEIDNPVDIQSPLSLRVLLQDKHIMLIVIILIFNSLVGNSLESTLPIFMIRTFCSDQSQQGIVWLFGMMSLLGFFLSTFLFHMRPSICWILPFTGLLINGVLCVSIPFCRPWWVIGIVIGLMYFHSSITDVILIPMVPKIIDHKYPKSSYGSGSGLTLLTFTISGIIGTFPVGPLVDQFGFLTLCIILCTFIVCLAPSVFLLRSYFKEGIYLKN